MLLLLIYRRNAVVVFVLLIFFSFKVIKDQCHYGVTWSLWRHWRFPSFDLEFDFECQLTYRPTLDFDTYSLLKCAFWPVTFRILAFFVIWPSIWPWKSTHFSTKVPLTLEFDTCHLLKSVACILPRNFLSSGIPRHMTLNLTFNVNLYLDWRLAYHEVWHLLSFKFGFLHFGR